MRGGDGEDVQPEPELEVVHLHGRPPFRPPGERAGLPDRRIQVVPGDDAVEADDAAEPAVGRCHPAGLEHPLVVRELQQVVPAFTGRRIPDQFRRLPGQPVQRRAVRGQATGIRVQTAMMLDVHRPVSGALGRHQDVGLADPAPGLIRWQPATDDHRRPVPHRGSGRRRPLASGHTGHHAGTGVLRQQFRDYLGLEPPARLEPALEHRRHRQRVARPEQVPLRPDRALLGHVTALRRHHGHVVMRGHSTIVRTRCVSSRGSASPARSHGVRRPRGPRRPAAATGSSPCSPGTPGGGR